VILRLWEFDSPRPHSFSILASESAKAESQTARCGHSADTSPLAECVRDLRGSRTRDGLWLRVVRGGHCEALVTERCRHSVAADPRPYRQGRVRAAKALRQLLGPPVSRAVRALPGRSARPRRSGRASAHLDRRHRQRQERRQLQDPLTAGARSRLTGKRRDRRAPGRRSRDRTAPRHPTRRSRCSPRRPAPPASRRTAA